MNKLIKTIIFWMIPLQIFGQSLSDRLESAFINNSQSELRKVLKSISLEADNVIVNDENEKVIQEVCNTIISSQKNYLIVYPIRLKKIKKQFVVVQNEIVYGFTDNEKIEPFVQRENEMNIDKTKLDTLSNSSRFIDVKRKFIVNTTDSLLSELEKFINIDFEKEYVNERLELIEKQLLQDDFIRPTEDINLVINTFSSKICNKDSLLREIISRRRVSFLQKQLSITSGESIPNGWRLEVYPYFNYIIFNEEKNRVWIQEKDCFIESILEKKRCGKWKIIDRINLGCL